MRASLAAAAFLAATVSAHGNITSPPARLAGPGMAKACGQSAVDSVLADGTIPLEDVFNTPPSCKLDLCRGAVFDDNKARVQQYTPGQVVSFKAIIPIPHEGPANVSIVKTATNTILGSMLLVFNSYADEKLKVLPANNTAFAVTIPSNLAANDCKVAGDCVLQWFWFGTAAKQTYESCVDFVIVSASNSGAGGGAGSGTLTSVTSATATGSRATGTASVGTTAPSAVSSNAGSAASSNTAAGSSAKPSETGSSEPSEPSETAASSSTGSTDAPEPLETGSSGSYNSPSSTSSADGSGNDSATSEDASIPIPAPAAPSPGSFGGTEGVIPERNEDGSPADHSSGGTYGSTTYRRKRFIRPDDVTNLK